MSAAESPASSTTLYAYLYTRGISVPEEVGERWRPEAVGKLSVGEVLNGPYSPKGKKWRPRAPDGIMPR